MKIKNLFLIILLSFFALNISAAEKKNQPTAGKWFNTKITSTYNNETFTVPVKIYFPQNYKKKKCRTFICLHNYNSTNVEWVKAKRIKQAANQGNFILVCPRMYRSVFTEKFYPETKEKWNQMPGILWVENELLPFIQQKFDLGKNAKSLGLLGVEIGAKGAFSIASRNSQNYSMLIGIGGYYDLLSAVNLRWLNATYGNYDKYKKRWKESNFAINNAKNLKNLNIYIGHGNKDYYAPFFQSRLMTIRLNQLKKKVNYKEYNYVSGGWETWPRLIVDALNYAKDNWK